MNAQQIKDRFIYYVNNHEGMYPPSAKAHGVYVGILNRVCKGDENRKLVLKYLTGQTSTKKLSDIEWIALKKLCDISPVELERIVGIILGEVVKQEGQITLEDVLQATMEEELAKNYESQKRCDLYNRIEQDQQ